MAAQRYISTSFWDDAWVQGLEPHEKLLYMYLLTNPLTNIAGVYEITFRRMSFDTGYPIDTLSKAIKKFSEDKKAYFLDDVWIILPNWPKHQRPTERNTIRAGIDTVLNALPDEVFSYLHMVDYKYDFLSELDRKPCPIDTLSIPYAYDPSYIDIDTDTDTDIDKDILSSKHDDASSDNSKSERTSEVYADIVGYLNDQTGASYKSTTTATRKKIDARLNEGYTLDDFKTVISKKVAEWQDTDMAKYLRPETLFGTKFESYLNQVSKVKTMNKLQSLYERYAEEEK